MKAYNEFEKRWLQKLDFWMNTIKGKELQLNLMAQGYETILFEQLTYLFASGFTAIEIMKKLREQIKASK